MADFDPTSPQGCCPCGEDASPAAPRLAAPRSLQLYGQEPHQGGSSPWPWVILGLAAIGAIIFWISRRESRLAGAALERGPEPLDPSRVIPPWSSIGDTVRAYASDGTIIHGYVIGHPGGMISLRIRRVEGDWREGRPKINDFIVVPPAALISKSKM